MFHLEYLIGCYLNAESVCENTNFEEQLLNEKVLNTMVITTYRESDSFTSNQNINIKFMLSSLVDLGLDVNHLSIPSKIRCSYLTRQLVTILRLFHFNSEWFHSLVTNGFLDLSVWDSTSEKERGTITAREPPERKGSVSSS